MSHRPTSFSRRKWQRTLALLGLLLGAASLLALWVGPTRLFLVDAFLNPGSHDAQVLLRIRLPWVVLAATVGASLSTVGVGFQALLRNPLADPFILGMSGGAALGVVLGSSIQLLPPSCFPLFGFAGALGATVLVWRLARTGGQTNSYTMLLSGVVVNAVFGAVIMFVVSLARPNEVYQTALWLMGILDVFLLSPLVLALTFVLTFVCIVALCATGKQMNALSLGDDEASHLGVNVDLLRRTIFVLGAILVGSSVAVAGPIGFVGLLVPHVLRFILGADHRLLLPASALGGAIFLLLAGSLARVLFAVTNSQLPAGVITACLGGPFFLWLLRRRGRLFG